MLKGGGAGRASGLAIVMIVASQWLGTSLWFSPSGASDDLSRWLQIDSTGFAWLVAATQLGFIFGTVVFALTGAADRFPPERIFVVSSLIGALLNAVWTWSDPAFGVVWAARFGVGIALAGIYPMGMKMIVQRVGPNSGWALGWLVAMLTLGTAMPHIMRALGAALPWQSVMWGSSILAIVAAMLILLVGSAGAAPRTPDPVPADDSPRQPIRRLLAQREFRASCGGYLGHMWELYAFWAVVPVLSLHIVRTATGIDNLATAATLSAVVIAAGSIGCIVGGLLSRRTGSDAVAAVALASSGLMCLLFPLIPEAAVYTKIGVLVLWGFFVIADSPQFSAMTAKYVPRQLIGSALTAQNSAGFAVTVVSIVAVQNVVSSCGDLAVWLLLPGPLLGLLALRTLFNGRRPVAAPA